MSPQDRSPEEIRRDIEQHRQELGEAIDRLRAEVNRASDWRAQIRQHQRQVLIAAAVAGIVLGGGLGGLAGVLTGGRRRRRG